jgi:protocatechuate 3,4-dioxygenase beta subunit
MVVRRLACILTVLGAVVPSASQTAGSSAQNPQQILQPEKKPETSTVSGRVVTAAEGAPIKSAQVGLVQEDAKQHPGIFAALTDSDGRFEIGKVPPGRYRFMASHTGFIANEFKAQGTGSGAVLALAPGQVVDDALFRLVRAAVISGRVVDEAGEPVMGIVLSALRKPTADEMENWGVRMKKEQLIAASSSITDDRGEYRMFGLRPGEYYLRASESPDDTFSRMQGIDWGLMDIEVMREVAAQYAPLYYPGVLQPGEAQAIPLRAGEEMQADFAMRRIKTVQISGHVIASDGKPASHAWVNLSLPEVDSFTMDLGANTESTGEFVIKGVPPGSYILSASQQVENRRFSTRQKIDVGESNLDSVVLAFGHGTIISGKVILAAQGLALERIHVYLSPEEEDFGPGGWAAEAKSDGSFEIPDVPDGSYALRVGGLEKGWYMKSARLGASDVLQKGLQVERGAAPGTLEIVLSSAAAALEGAVTQDDKPVAGASVRARPEPETPYNRMRSRGAETDQNGHFSLDTLPPGKYKVIAKLPSASPEVPALSSEAKVVMLGEHDHQAVQITLPKEKEQ